MILNLSTQFERPYKKLLNICFDRVLIVALAIGCLTAEFWPVFRLVDEVTEGDSVYTGPYTLRVVAGGVSLEDMTHFQFSQQM